MDDEDESRGYAIPGFKRNGSLAAEYKSRESERCLRGVSREESDDDLKVNDGDTDMRSAQALSRKQTGNEVVNQKDLSMVPPPPPYQPNEKIENGDVPASQAHGPFSPVQKFKRDVAAKDAARTASRATSPGVVRMSPKPQVRAPILQMSSPSDSSTTTVPTPSLLERKSSRFERDMALKNAERAAARATLPGAVSTSPLQIPGPPNFTWNESMSSHTSADQDKQIKDRLRAERARLAVLSSPPLVKTKFLKSPPSQHEQDMQAKEMIRRGRSLVESSQDNSQDEQQEYQAFNSLRRLPSRHEQDMQAKERIRRELSLVQSNQGPSKREQQDRLAKNRGRAVTGGSAQSLEDDVAAKRSATGSSGGIRPGAYSYSQVDESGLEANVASKQRGLAPTRGHSLRNLEDSITRKTSLRSNGATPQQLLQNERDLLCKHQDFSTSANSNNTPRQLTRVEQDLMNKKRPHIPEMEMMLPGSQSAAERIEEFSSHVDLGVEDETQPVDTLARDEVGSIREGDDAIESSDEQTEIEAYVAEPAAVDALQVSVVLSEDEEKKAAKNKQRRLQRYFLACFVLVLVAVIVPTTLVLTRDNKKIVTLEDEAPSSAPSDAPSASPTSNIFANFVSNLESFYQDYGELEYYNEVFSIVGSSQYRAALWMTENQRDLSVNNTQVINQFLLAVFYFATEGDTWLLCHREDKGCAAEMRWLSGSNYCEWFLISCDDSGEVIEVFSPTTNSNRDVGMRGTFPLEIGFLDQMEQIVLSTSSVGGTVPESLIRLTKLRTFIMFGNELTGTIPEFLISDQMSSLEIMNLRYNNFEGPLPKSLNSTILRSVRLGNNELTGTIPSEIKGLGGVSQLYLNDNQFTGEIPTELFTLPLISLFLQENNALGGSLPSEVGQLSSLKRLSLMNTAHGGQLPEEFFRLNLVEDIDMRNCSFSGHLSDSFANLSNLESLMLSDNDLSGEFRSEQFTDLRFLHHLELHGNNLVGNVTQNLCDQRGETALSIRFLSVDCAEPPKVFCDCCENCTEILNSSLD